MIKTYIDRNTFYEVFDVYCKDLYSEELLINSFKKILDKLNISYPSEYILNEYMDENTK